MSGNKNAFDLLRLLLATGVITSHAYLLGNYGTSDFLTTFSKGQTNLADISVMGFFVLSGYLITASFERSANLASFVAHRLLRIYPGFWICLLVVGFGFTALIGWITNSHDFSLFGNNSAWGYFHNNMLIRINQWSVGNVLSKNAYKESIDGSLWSLYPEVQCYILTLVLGFFGLFRKYRYVVLALFIFVSAVYVEQVYFGANIGPTFLYLSNALKLYAAYLAGTTLYLFRDKAAGDKRLLIFIGLFTILLLRFGGFQLLSPLLLGYLLIYAFQLFPLSLKYDISYGVYIYGFAIQQVLYAYFGNSLPLIFFISLSLVIAALFGLLSFVLVENHGIRLRKPVDRFILKFWRP